MKSTHYKGSKTIFLESNVESIWSISQEVSKGVEKGGWVTLRGTKSPTPRATEERPLPPGFLRGSRGKRNLI